MIAVEIEKANTGEKHHVAFIKDLRKMQYRLDGKPYSSSSSTSLALESWENLAITSGSGVSKAPNVLSDPTRGNERSRPFIVENGGLAYALGCGVMLEVIIGLKVEKYVLCSLYIVQRIRISCCNFWPFIC